MVVGMLYINPTYYRLVHKEVHGVWNISRWYEAL